MGSREQNGADDEQMQVFILRLWPERREIKGASPLLRGTIEHVPSGRRQAFSDLEGILVHLQPYLEALGLEMKNVEKFKGIE